MMAQDKVSGGSTEGDFDGLSVGEGQSSAAPDPQAARRVYVLEDRHNKRLWEMYVGLTSLLTLASLVDWDHFSFDDLDVNHLSQLYTKSPKPSDVLLIIGFVLIVLTLHMEVIAI